MLIVLHPRLNGMFIVRSVRPPSVIPPSAFGFLAGKEVKAAGVGNLGLRDREPGSRIGFLIH